MTIEQRAIKIAAQHFALHAELMNESETLRDWRGWAKWLIECAEQEEKRLKAWQATQKTEAP